MIGYSLLLGHHYILEIAYNLLLNLEVDFQFDVLKLEHVVFDDHLEELPVVVELYPLGDIVSDLFGHCHALHQVYVHQLLLYVVFDCAHLQSGYRLLVLLNLIAHTLLLLLVSGFSFPQKKDLPLPPFDLQNVEGVLLLKLHQRPSKLYPLVEVLKYLFLDFLHLLLLLPPSTTAGSTVSLHSLILLFVDDI